MEHDTISALRIDLYACTGRPSTILRPYEPKEFKNHAWIPQTIGDQIWVLYEFETTEQRVAWEISLPQEIAMYLDRGLIEYALPYGWSVRDPNGFPVG